MDYVQPIGAAPDAPYIDANPGAGIEGSPVPAAAIEHPMREILAAIEAAGLQPDGEDLTQLGQAIQALIAAAIAGLNAADYLKYNVSDVLEAAFFSEAAALAIDAGAVTPVLAGAGARNVFTVAATADFTLGFPAAVPGAGMALIVATQDAVGGHALTLAGGYKLAAGKWSTLPNAVNLLWLTMDGGAVIDVVIAQRGA